MSNIKGWRYYNKAIIPATPPHEIPNMDLLNDKHIWNKDNWDGGSPLLARWTTDWDCGYETEWWYCIKDKVFDISELKSKRRYEIKKGCKNYNVYVINPLDYNKELLDVTRKAYLGWPEKYRPNVTEEGFNNEIKTWDRFNVFGAFDVSNGELCGYALLEDNKSYVEFSVLRTEPIHEKNGINAVIVYEILEYYKDRFNGDFYINDGARAIRHETAFQDYLEKYFGFRKAYCKLHVRYKKPLGLIVNMLYPFRAVISNKTNLGSSVASILKMEEITRSI